MFKRATLLIVIFSLIFLAPFIYYKAVKNFEKPAQHETKLQKVEQQEETPREENVINEKIERDEGEKNQDAASPRSANEPVIETEAIEADLYMAGLGDSLTKGVGDSTGQGYIGMLKNKIESATDLDVVLNNFGKRGQRSDQLLQMLKTKKNRKALENADFIFMTIGANDVMQVFKNHFFHLEISLFEQKNEEFRHHLRESFKLIREENPHAPIYLTGLFNPFMNYFADITEIEQIIHIWNDSSQAVAAEFTNVHFVPIQSIFTDIEESLLYEDYFHPNTKGYALIADEIMNRMHIEGDIDFNE